VERNGSAIDGLLERAVHALCQSAKKRYRERVSNKRSRWMVTDGGRSRIVGSERRPESKRKRCVGTRCWLIQSASMRVKFEIKRLSIRGKRVRERKREREKKSRTRQLARCQSLLKLPPKVGEFYRYRYHGMHDGKARVRESQLPFYVHVLHGRSERQARPLSRKTCLRINRCGTVECFFNYSFIFHFQTNEFSSRILLTSEKHHLTRSLKL